MSEQQPERQKIDAQQDTLVCPRTEPASALQLGQRFERGDGHYERGDGHPTTPGDNSRPASDTPFKTRTFTSLYLHKPRMAYWIWPQHRCKTHEITPWHTAVDHLPTTRIRSGLFPHFSNNSTQTAVGHHSKPQQHHQRLNWFRMKKLAGSPGKLVIMKLDRWIRSIV